MQRLSRAFIQTSGVITTSLACLAGPVLGQRTDSSSLEHQRSLVAKRAPWIVSQGLQANYDAIRRLFTPQRSAALFPQRYTDSKAYVESRIDYLAQDLATMYTADSILRLEANGIDLLKAYATGYTAQTSLDRSESVVIAEFVRADLNADLGDGYFSTLTFKVIEVLKGKRSSQTLYIREVSGIDRDNMMHFTSGRFFSRGDSGTLRPPIEGTRYLLSVSAGIYPLTALERGHTPAKTGGPYVVIQQVPLRIDGDRLIPASEGSLLPGAVPTSLATVRRSMERVRPLKTTRNVGGQYQDTTTR